MKKRLWVQHGPSHDPQIDTVHLNGVAPAEQLTPSIARRAASVALGVPWGCTVTDPMWGHGYRLYRQSARKLQGAPDWQRLAKVRVSATHELAGHAEIIFYDWHEHDHLQWIATAPIAEIVHWAEAVTPQPPDGQELFELFVAHGVTTAEIAAQDLPTLTRQVTELRADDPDSINMTDGAIAQAIRTFAIQDAAGRT